MRDSSAARVANGSPPGGSKTRRAPRGIGAGGTGYSSAIARELRTVGVVDAELVGRLNGELTAELGEGAPPKHVAALLRSRIDEWVGRLAVAQGIRSAEAAVAGRAALLAMSGEHAWSDDILAGVPSKVFQRAFAQALPVACPPDAPLAMPTQSLRRWEPDQPAILRARRRSLASWRRPTLILGAALASTGFATYELSRVMDIGGFSFLEIALLVLFVPNFLWIAVSFWTAFAGVVALWKRSPVPGLQEPADISAPLTTRTAVIALTANEDASRIFGGLEAIYESVRATGQLAAFEFLVLSGSTRPANWLSEEIAWDVARRRLGATGKLFYRHLLTGEARKAGNVADFVQRWGGRYDHFMILDADSLITGEALVRLARLLENNPQAGILQTVPRNVNRNTLFARVQQFAGRLYGPVLAAGLSYWHQGASNYWGHNAMIRTRAFAEAAGMPVLPGKLPFGGHILSHDFVEAALMCRAGWGAYLLPDVDGSYEESPPSLIDSAQRDRRWCQGNLQHAAVIGGTGLRLLSRLHLLTGIMSYVASPLWFLFIVVGIFAALQARFELPVYFLPTEKTLFPVWPIIDAERAARLFAATMMVLMAPKMFGLLVLVRDRVLRKGFGGLLRAFLGVVVETLYSTLCAPILMLLQSRFVAEVVLGRDSGWKAQVRDDRGIPFGEAFRRHRGHMLLGCGLGAAAWVVSPALLAWMSPAVVGLVLAAPISYIGSRLSWGLAARRLGLLTIPEERVEPPIVADATERTDYLSGRIALTADPLREVLTDQALFMLHGAVVGQGLREGEAGDSRLAKARHVLAERAREQDPLAFLDTGQLLSVFGDLQTLLAVRRRMDRPRRSRQ